jgi:DNA polymerase-1
LAARAGLRIDHLLLSANASNRLVDAAVDREIRAKNGASDHAPAWLVLRDAPRRRADSARAIKAPGSPVTRGQEKRQGSGSGATRRPLFVIDGDYFAHRAYHALPKTILRQGGRPAGAILGFANALLRLYRQEQPRAVVIAWDTLESPTYRHQSFPAYQSGRHFDAALLEQLKLLPKLVGACGFANAQAPGYEADDFLAAAATAEERKGGTAVVASGDRDSFQLATESITILYPVRGGEMVRIGPDEVRARYGVSPSQVPDFIALRGDPSDKLPGVLGLGARGAADLLREHGSLDNILKSGRFASQASRLALFRSIATMDRKAPLPKLVAQMPNRDNAANLAREWELEQLAERLDELHMAAGKARTAVASRPRGGRSG